MARRILILVLALALLTACGSPATATPAASVPHEHEHGKKVVASTSWVGAFALAAGAEEIIVIAPSNIQHPPDYDPKPSDLEAISGADYVLYAGFEGFAPRMQEAVGGSSDKLITVATENSPEAIHKEVTRLGELFGTQDKAAAFLETFDAEYAKLSEEVKAAVGDQKPVVVTQMFVTPWVFFAGLEPAGMYGPMPMTPDELKTLSDAKPTMVFENAHMGGGDPLVEATGAQKVDLINFPGDDMDLLSVFRQNAETLKSAFGGMTGTHGHSHTEYPLTIENCGRSVTFEKAPERVITTWQAPAELLVKLGLGSRIVGTVWNAQFPAPADIADEFDKLPVLSEEGASKEAVFAANPDFILASFLAWDFDAASGAPTLKEVEDAGIRVFGLSDNCTASDHVHIEDMYSDILKIGQIFDVQDSTEALVNDMKARVAAVQEKIAGLPPTKAFFDAGGEGPIGTAGQGLQHDMIVLAGGENIFADYANYYESVSLEEVAARQPEIFVVDTWSDPAYINSRSEWLFTTFSETPAAKDKRFVEIPGIYIYFASIRFADGIEMMAEAFHPEAFAAAPSYPVTIENCGNTLTFDKAPERALVTYQNVAEIMVKLGLTDKIVGVTYGKAYPSPADMPEVDTLNYLTEPGSGSASKEVELSTNPDIVISAYPTYDFDAGQGMATQEEFVAAGAPVYGISAECDKSMPGGTIETVYSDILNLGKIFGVESRAEAVVQEMKGRIAVVQSKVGNLPPVQVAFYDAGEEQIGVYGSGLNSDMIALAGGENVFANETDVYLQVSKEVFAVKTPEIFAVLDYEGAAGVPDEITRAKFLFTTFPNMQASKDKRWVPVSGAAFAAGIRIPDAIESMAKAFHPEAFQ